MTAGLHLKSFLSEGFDNEIIIGSSHAAQKAKQFMEPVFVFVFVCCCLLLFF